MPPIPPNAAFAAGAALAAARDAGLDEVAQAHAAVIAAEAVRKEDRMEQAKAQQDAPEPPEEPARHHGPGLALRIARWLNLR